ncbi:hypothetical protein K2X30_07070 [bacterium]|nr:hypothetical protein [bacterium]
MRKKQKRKEKLREKIDREQARVAVHARISQKGYEKRIQVWENEGGTILFDEASRLLPQSAPFLSHLQHK